MNAQSPIAIRVLREAGGLGDVIRCLPVMAGLRKRYSEAALWVWGVPEYRAVWEHGEAPPDCFIPVSISERRPRGATPDPARWPYLERSPSPALPLPRFEMTIDLFCPGWQHEAETGGRPYKDRIECFCEAAGVAPSVPRWIVRPEERAAALEWLRRQSPRRMSVGLQPFSTSTVRNWPLANWIELARRLLAAGKRVIVFDCVKGRSASVPGVHCFGEPIALVAAIIAELDLMIAPDSGLFHLAGAVGTRTIGLFGSTEGNLIAKWYPRAIILQGRGENSCDSPCHFMRARGYRSGHGQDSCGARGCGAIQSVRTESVWKAIERVA